MCATIDAQVQTPWRARRFLIAHCGINYNADSDSIWRHYPGVVPRTRAHPGSTGPESRHSFQWPASSRLDLSLSGQNNRGRQAGAPGVDSGTEVSNSDVSNADEMLRQMDRVIVEGGYPRVPIR